MKRLAALFLLFCTPLAIFAQETVSGTVRDVTSGEALVGAVVVVGDGKVFASTNIDGVYTLRLANGTYVLNVKYVGYTSTPVTITVDDLPLTVDINMTSTTLKEVEIVADVAIDRKTPVAFSNISATRIREEVAGRDITMMLNSTPGAYATEQGGGSGDSRVNIRGSDQRNVGVMVDGVPVNDMENGQVYWSNWAGLGDVTRTMQVQRGLGASRLAIPSVGGTINILTQGIGQRSSFILSTEFGNNSMQKLSLGINTGEIGKGWGLTFAGSRSTGNGWADQTWNEAFSYFFKVQKRTGAHLFSFSVNGAPQSHGQRYDRLPIAVYDRKFAESLGIDADSVYASNNGYTTLTQGARGRRYNPNWGFINYEDGQVGTLNQDINFFHKPLFNLSWYWTPNDRFVLSTVTYLSIAGGGGTNFNSAINRDTLTGQLKITDAYISNSTYIDALYSTTEHKSTRVLLASMNDHVWYGALSTATWTPSEKMTYLFGIDARHYIGSHYRKVYDLIGGDYYVDAADKNQPWGMGNLSYSMKRTDDKVGYYNQSTVDWGGLFAQAEYAGEKWSAFFTLSGSMSWYQRIDHFKKRDIVMEDGTIIPMIVGYDETYYTNGSQSGVAQHGATVTTSGDTTYINNPSGADYTIAGATGYAWDSDFARTATTEKKQFPGYTVKTGVNYNINDHYNVFVNVGHLNLAPRFNTVFDNNNKEYPAHKNQQVYAAELGFGIRYPGFAANVNGYYTNWLNKPPYSSPTTTIAGDPYTYDLTGLNTTLQGLEFDFNWKALRTLQVEGLASFGNWIYNSAGTVYLYDANYTLEDTISYSAKGVHLGDAAQTQVGGSLRWEPFKGFYLKPRYTYFARNYANFDPIVLVPVYNGSGVQVGDNRDQESWKMPAYGLLDFFAGYELREMISKEKNKFVVVTFTFSVINILDTKYISDAQNGASFDASTALVYMGMGRRWNAGMRFSF